MRVSVSLSDKLKMRLDKILVVYQFELSLFVMQANKEREINFPGYR
jgi:hypothetical protein